MKLFPLILITVIYLLILTLFNYSLYKLLTNDKFGHQYYLILIYFLCEAFAVIIHFFPNKKEIIIGDINPYIITTEMSGDYSISDLSNNISNIRNNSSLSNIRNNSDNSNISITSNNFSSTGSIESNFSKIPFIGIKCVTFIITSLLDFISKLFIYNGIKYMKQDSILRCIIEIIMASVGSLIILKLKKIYYSLIGLSIIILYLLIHIFSHKAKENFTGILLLSEGGLLNSIQYIIQSKYFLKGEQFIYRIVSWEGLYGSIISFFFLILASFINCPFEKDNDNNKNDNNVENKDDYDFIAFCNDNKLEKNITSFFSDIKNCVPWFIIYFISCILYSFSGVFITKYVNVNFRASLDCFRMLFFIIVLLINNK